MDPESGDQPLIGTSGDVAVAVNGEIYNHLDIRKRFSKYGFKTGSDCEVLLPMYSHYGQKRLVEMVSQLDGQFAFVLSDAKTGFYMAARDPIGIASLYYGFGQDGEMWFSSELKALKEQCVDFHQFPPGHVYDSVSKKFVPYFTPKWYVSKEVPTGPLVYAKIREVLTRAVEKRLMSDVPWGVLLSGGLDSSLVASIASRILYKRKQQSKSLFHPQMHSFSIGLVGSPDLAAARKVADYLQTVHHEMTFTVQDGLDAVRDVIYHLETCV
jgi:asparagine synthase (glutamine-hydrolysing)